MTIVDRGGRSNFGTIYYQECIQIELKHFLILLIRLKTIDFCEVAVMSSGYI